MGTKCNLVGGAGGTLQLLLGIIAFNCLVLKRYWEVPRRPWKIWFYDSSKQGSAAVLVHILNLMLSRYMMKQADSEDECTWYFTNVMLDVTVGLLVTYLLLRGTAYIVHSKRLHMLRSGDYGTPPRWKNWAAQLLVYNFLMMLEKLFVSLVLLAPAARKIGESMLSPIGRLSPRLELAVALFITPLIINIIWFWLIDNLLMDVETKHMQKTTKRAMSNAAARGSRPMNERLLDHDSGSDEEVDFSELDHIELQSASDFVMDVDSSPSPRADSAITNRQPTVDKFKRID